AVPDVDDAGVLAGALEDPGRFRREHAEERFRVLVSAVLGPERAEHAQLREGRRSAQRFDDALVLLLAQAVLRHQLGRNLRLVTFHLCGFQSMSTPLWSYRIGT